MVNEVNKLIFNTLVEQGAVYIPNIGTLSICRTPSRKRGRRVVPPSYSVAFTTERNAKSLSDVITAMTNVNQEFADDIVARWQTKATIDGRVVIAGVGSISNGSYTPDKELIAKLNINTDTINLKGNSNGKKWALVLGVLLSICALAISIYNIVVNRDDEPIQSVQITSSNDSATESSSAINKDIKSDDIAIDITKEKEAVNEPITIPETEVEVDTKVDTILNEPAVSEPITEEVATASEVDDWRGENVSHYVIFGSYSTMTNANNAITKIERRNPSAQCKVIRIGAMYGIAVYGSTNRDECATFKRQNRTVYKDAWIHTPKH